ncbi:sulfotransferase [Psychroflexus sp. ALD_RP9]|uniref:sulfotransferase n=1 Tax=Psychroflexus sp. ALD_RP9 TaxID=2777186 RepID=UPI001A8CBD52|nr:sulfotransferase [Psychroflexus sp. ALD_RP9]QSS96388.1 sulfotransferase [Psychroflexus sp. ALD_RP9]
MEYLKNQNLTFLLCSERSGSNFITKLLNNHSKICGPSTKHLINPVVRNAFRYQPFNLNDNWSKLIDDILNLFKVSFSIWKSDFTKQELLREINVGDLDRLILYFFSKETRANFKQNCFIKEIKTFEFYAYIKHFFPEANFIYQVRDVRDMALSWKKNQTHYGGIIAAARQWKNDQQQYLKIKMLEDINHQIISITYEDLVSDTKNTLENVLKLFDLNFEIGMLDMGSDDLTSKNAKQQKAWENLSKPVMKNNFNKFKSQLSIKEIQYIEKIAFFEMKQLGYNPENSWDQLKSIDSREIEAYHQYELAQLKYNPVKGVIDNMSAKKRFYQHSK